jgi:hypothetical protein
MKLLAAAFAFALTFAAVPDAHGASAVRAQTGGGELGPDYVRADASDLGAGTYPGATPVPNAAPSTAPVYTWERVPTGGQCVVVADTLEASRFFSRLSPLPGLFFFPDLPMQVTPLMGAPIGGLRYDGPSPLPDGIAYAGDLVTDIATPIDPADTMVVIPRCVLPGDPVPPTPPTAAQIWQQTPLPRAHIHANPPGTRAWPGVVHLVTRLWTDALAETQAAVALPGFAIDVRARPIAYAWIPGDGTSVVRPGPGSIDDAVPADYPQRGDHTVTLYVVWVGSAHTWSPALGLDFGEQWLGTVTLPVRTVHHVAEVRALLHS